MVSAIVFSVILVIAFMKNPNGEAEEMAMARFGARRPDDSSSFHKKYPSIYFPEIL